MEGNIILTTEISYYNESCLKLLSDENDIVVAKIMNPFNLELVLPRVDLEPSSRIEVLELKVYISYSGYVQILKM